MELNEFQQTRGTNFFPSLKTNEKKKTIRPSEKLYQDDNWISNDNRSFLTNSRHAGCLIESKDILEGTMHRVVQIQKNIELTFINQPWN